MTKTNLTGEELIDEATGYQNGNMSDELLEIWEECGSDHDDPVVTGITVVDDRTDRVDNEETMICMLVDVLCADGVTVRLGLFNDGGMVVDHCDGMDTIEEWADGWDTDGSLPEWLSH
jgi:hypothetical protein